MNRQTEIFSLRKSKVGLASVMIALMWFGTGVGAVAKADETAIMSTEIEAKVTETPLAIEEEAEGEGEGEELIETVKTERHPDAYKIPTERLEKTEDGQHQVLVEPILEHANNEHESHEIG